MQSSMPYEYQATPIQASSGGVADLPQTPVETADTVLAIQAGSVLPEALTRAVELLGLHVDLIAADQDPQVVRDAGPIALAVLCLDDDARPDVDLSAISHELATLCVPILVLTPHGKPADGFNATDAASRHGILYAGADESADMLHGRLATLMAFRPIVASLMAETEHLRTVSQPLSSYFSQVNEEMRLAARLQRDFLPRSLPEVPGVQFATVFRPASWVSGDIYDVARLDEDHVGFYIADAVGHGMPAALLTMFIKRALVTKVIEDNHYRLVDPGEAIARLNEDMVAQEMSNFQFATCCYGLLNTRTRELRVASAGHPAPMRITPDGKTTELPVSGALLGVFAGKKYETLVTELNPGEKLLLYSDGVELAFINEGPDKPLRFREEFGNLAEYDIRQMCTRLLDTINREEGSLHPRDDVTILGVEIAESNA